MRLFIDSCMLFIFMNIWLNYEYFSDMIQPIALSIETDSNHYVGEFGIVSGYGRTTEGNYLAKKLKTTLEYSSK